jgi:DNA gyrase subunit B
VELALTVLHAGGKFDKDTYKVSGGLHGVGVSVVNALSEWLRVEVRATARSTRSAFARGDKTQELTVVIGGATGRRGTTVSFKPDPRSSRETTYSFDTLSDTAAGARLPEQGRAAHPADERARTRSGEVRVEEYHYEGGIKTFVEHLRGSRKPLHPEPIYIEANRGGGDRDRAAVRRRVQRQHLHLRQQHQHPRGRHAPHRVQVGADPHHQRLRPQGGALQEGRPGRALGRRRARGAHLRLSVKVKEPQFEGQTKTKLGNSEVKGAVESVVNEKLSEFLEENPGVARAIIEKALSAARAREAARKARDLTRKKSALETGVLPGKLADCSTNNPRSPRSTSSRATPPAARPSRGATASSRRSSRSRARS